MAAKYRIYEEVVMARIYVGIPCYAESDRLRQTVECIRSTTTEEYHLDIQVEKQSVVLNKNAILSRARKSNAEFVAFCDDDVEPMNGWDSSLIAGMDEVERETGVRVGQSTPQLVLPDGRVFAAWFNACFGLPVASSWIDSVAYGVERDARFNMFVMPAAVAGTMTVFRREFLESCKWQFDDRYERSQWEDIDQSLTCRAAGFEVVYDGHVVVVHHVTGVSPRAGTENRQRLLQKWGGRSELSRIVTETMALRVSHERVRGVVRAEGGRMSSADIRQVVRELGRNPIGRVSEGVKIVMRGGWGSLLARLRSRRHRIGR